MKSLIVLCAIFFVGSSGSSLRIPLQKWNPEMNFAQLMSGHSVPLKNFVNEYYVGEIAIGTPPQPFRVIFSTGTMDSWVVASKCEGNNTVQHTFDSSKSSTYQEIGVKGIYGFGSSILEGYSATDVVSIAGLNVNNAEFLEIKNISGEFEHFPTFDGWIGLSFNNNNKTIFNGMVNQHLVDSPIFSVHFSSDPSYKVGGEITFGGIDESLYTGELNYVPVTSNILSIKWLVNLNNVQINGNILANKTHKAEIELSTNIILGPKSQVDVINRVLGGRYNTTDEVWYVDCATVDSSPPINFIIDGKDFPLEPKHYIFKTPDGCKSKFMDSGTSRWTLGTPFISKYYTVYDVANRRIGFANSVQNVQI